MLFSFQTVRMLAVILFLFGGGSLFAYRQIVTSQLKKRVFWLGIGGALLSVLLTIAIHVWGIPRGLSAQYFPNAIWTEDTSIELRRYFEPDGTGRRTDRFVDFNPNDFNDRYPFSGKAFTVKWDGFLYLPSAGMQISIDSNFDSWLFIDDTLTEFRMATPQSLDIGTPAARPYLKKGWSFDERRKDQQLNFAWAVNDDAHFLLGIQEVADYELSFRCTPFSYPGSSPQQVSVFLEGTQIGDFFLKDGWETYTLSVPSAVIEKLGAGSVNVMLRFSRVTKPSAVIAGSGDTRELAAAFDRVELHQISPANLSKTVQIGKNVKPGFHKITIRAKSSIGNPFIRLMAQMADQTRPTLIREDVLFPAQQSYEFLITHFPIERRLLQALFGIEIISGLIFACLFSSAAFPYLCQPQRWGSREMLAIGSICVAAFLIRLLFLFETQQTEPNFYILTEGTDPLAYVFFARGFFRGYWPVLTHAPFYFTPLISLYMIVVSMLFGEHLIAVRMMTALLGSISVVLTYVIARRVTHRMIAYTAAVFCAGNGILIFYDISLLSDPLVVVLNLAALCFMLKWDEELSIRTTALLGITLGLTALSRGTIALLMPFFFFYTFRYGAGTVRQKIRHVTMLCLIVGLTILPITLYNYFSNPKHPLVFVSTNGGMNLWIGNNPSATGLFAFSPIALQEAGKRIQQSKSSYVAEVMRFIREHPAQYVRLAYKKFRLFWSGYEIDNNISYYFSRIHSRILLLPWINFVLLAPLGVVGMFASLRQRKRLFLLYLFVGIQLVSIIIFFMTSRFRLPVIPILSIFAACGILEIISRIQQQRWMSAALLCGLFAVAYLVLNYADAARYYERHQGKPMPFSRVLRYWELFSWEFYE